MSRRSRTGVSLAAVCLIVACADPPQDTDTVLAAPEYVGSSACATCHEREHDEWRGSHHELAMQAVSEESVLGDFDGATFDYFGSTARFFTRDGNYFVRT